MADNSIIKFIELKAVQKLHDIPTMWVTFLYNLSLDNKQTHNSDFFSLCCCFTPSSTQLVHVKPDQFT